MDFFSCPRAITTGGVAFDIPFINIVASNDGDSNKKRQFNQQIGILSSALEHAVPEQMFVNEQNPGEAISAVKALQKASAQGQRIYQITQANQASTLPNIHHAQTTMDEIRNALNAGKEVTTHTDAVQVPGWSGAGYIIIDPTTGDGAYKISGGGNGSFYDYCKDEDGGKAFWICSIYIAVYECVNDDDLSCGVGYLVAGFFAGVAGAALIAAGSSVLGAVAIGLGLSLAILDSIAAYDATKWSDLPDIIKEIINGLLIISIVIALAATFSPALAFGTILTISFSLLAFINLLRVVF